MKNKNIKNKNKNKNKNRIKRVSLKYFLGAFVVITLCGCGNDNVVVSQTNDVSAEVVEMDDIFQVNHTPDMNGTENGNSVIDENNNEINGTDDENLESGNIIANESDGNMEADNSEADNLETGNETAENSFEAIGSNNEELTNDTSSTSNDDMSVTSGLAYCTTGDAQLDDLCKSVLDRIITPDMSSREQAYAVYYWVENNIRYSGNSDTSDWKQGAITALSLGKGDCYAFCTASRALLISLGFDAIEIHKETGNHYWVMVNVDGAWYHFDATTGWGTERFLWTDAQLEEYQYYSSKYDNYISYNWDHSLYPATP